MIRVAAVDDHRIVLQGLTVLLSSTPGISVVAVARSVDEFFGGPGRGADVVLLDLDLGAGTTPTENIRRLTDAGLRVLVLSATATPDAVRSAVMAGACGYVTKGDDVDELVQAIQAVAADGSWLSPQLAFALLADPSPDKPALSIQETEALRLYATGLPLKSVARQMGVGKDTAKQYIDRVRGKYRKAGREASTKVDLYQRAVEDGHLPREATGHNLPPSG